MLRTAVERWLQVAIEACVDIAYHLIGNRGWTPPDSARDAFRTLASHGLADPGLPTRLGRAAGLRNVRVHDHVAVDLDKLAATIGRELGDRKPFGAVAGRWLQEA